MKTRPENGAFTRPGGSLAGKADYTEDHSVTVNELDLYVSERVKKLTNNQQTPVTAKPKTIQDFPLAAQ